MPIQVKVAIATAVVDENPACVVKAEFTDDVAVIHLDARRQDHRRILGLPRGTKLHWSKDTREYEAQELSAFPWPIRYRVVTADAWYSGPDGQRVHYSPPILHLDPRAKVSDAVKRAAVLLVVIAAIGFRRTAWLLRELFRVETSKSTLARWTKEVAEELPSPDEIVRILNEEKPITEGHFDEIFPRGKRSGCVLVLKDEHGRIVATEEIEERSTEEVQPFLERVRDLGLKIKTFYIDTCNTYRKTIPLVFPQAKIQLDNFHIIQNVWRHVWKHFVRRRRTIAARAEKVSTPWYKAQLKALAKALWQNRHLVFKAEKRMSDEEKAKLVEICEADREVGRLRAFLSGVWKIFDGAPGSGDEEARKALADLKAGGYAEDSKHHETSIKFLDETFSQATTYLREEGVKRNSLAESGMRTLRRQEAEHDGFRSGESRADFLRIYQAVKYLGWSVHGPLRRPSPAPP